jgi:hypothetical protein
MVKWKTTTHFICDDVGVTSERRAPAQKRYVASASRLENAREGVAEGWVVRQLLCEPNSEFTDHIRAIAVASDDERIA